MNSDIFYLNLIKITTLGILSSLISFLLVPLYLKIAIYFRLGDRYVDEERLKKAPIASELHKEKEGIPTMGGIIIWLPPIILAILFFILSKFFGGFYEFLNFLSRKETYLPLFGLFLGGFLGLIDDLLTKLGKGFKFGAKQKFLVYFSVALFFSWWFVIKLNYKFIELVDFRFPLSFLFIFILFIFIFLAIAFSFNEIDGLDGLFAGVAISVLIFLLLVSIFEEKYNLASFISTLLGSLFVYLWFNSYPALFFGGNNGSFSVGTAIALISFLTGTYLLFSLVGIILVIESGSVIIQIFSKKFLKRKIFLSSPIHNHFRAKGMKEPKVVVRFWLINFLGVILGFIIYLIFKLL